MAVCKFFQQGHCRFGDSCRYEHVGNARPAPSNSNRFAPLQSPTNSNPRNGNSYNQSGQSTDLPYGLDKAAILADLQTETPQWILSAYGPGRAAPVQLFGGQREQSFEEMRLLHYMRRSAGQEKQATQEYDGLVQAAYQQMQVAARDVDAAIQFIVNGEREHPNRIDIVNQTVAANSGAPSNVFAKDAQSNPFGQNISPLPNFPKANPFSGANQTATPAAGGFGQPSTLGFKPSPFTAPAPTQPGLGSFGQPSALGQKPSPFSNPPPAFAAAQPSVGTFGQPSSLGQKPSPFGPASSGSGGSGFAAFAHTPASFLQPPHTTGPFGAPSQQPQVTAFGQPSGQQTMPLGVQLTQSPFGAPSSAAKNPFLPSQQAQQQTLAPAFNPFAKQPATAPPAGNAISNPMTSSAPIFVAAQQRTATALDPRTNLQTASVSPNFSPSQPQAQASNPLAPVLHQPKPVVNGSISGGPTLGAEHADISTYSAKGADGRLRMFKNKPVVYKKIHEEDKDEVPIAGLKRPDGRWEKIIFPDGPPPVNRDAAMSPEHYAGNDALKAQYAHAAQHGSFKDGKMPMIPPMQEWCSFDF